MFSQLFCFQTATLLLFCFCTEVIYMKNGIFRWFINMLLLFSPAAENTLTSFVVAMETIMLPNEEN